MTPEPTDCGCSKEDEELCTADETYIGCRWRKSPTMTTEAARCARTRPDGQPCGSDKSNRVHHGCVRHQVANVFCERDYCHAFVPPPETKCAACGHDKDTHRVLGVNYVVCNSRTEPHGDWCECGAFVPATANEPDEARAHAEWLRAYSLDFATRYDEQTKRLAHLEAALAKVREALSLAVEAIENCDRHVGLLAGERWKLEQAREALAATGGTQGSSLCAYCGHAEKSHTSVGCFVCFNKHSFQEPNATTGRKESLNES